MSTGRVRKMPVFYFDSREGSRFISDDEGLELPDLNAAEREAAEAAAEIGRDRLPKGDARDVSVEVRNEHGQRVLTVTITMELHRVDPSPEPPSSAETRLRVPEAAAAEHGGRTLRD